MSYDTALALYVGLMFFLVRYQFVRIEEKIDRLGRMLNDRKI